MRHDPAHERFKTRCFGALMLRSKNPHSRSTFKSIRDPSSELCAALSTNHACASSNARDIIGARKDDLISAAKRNGADDELVYALNKLPDKEFSGPDQVQKALF